MHPLKSIRTLSLSLVLVARLAAQPPLAEKPMITEVCPYETEAVEIANFSPVPADLTAHVVKWRFGGTTYTSSPLGVVLAPGQIVVVRDGNGGGPNLGIPGHVGQYLLLPPITVPFGVSVSVALVDGAGVVVDEVQVRGLAAGSVSAGSLGGGFRGLADLGQVASGPTSTERIWGLDSDGARDWCQAVRPTVGLENTASGTRAGDLLPLRRVVINEVDARQTTVLNQYHTIEIQNRELFMVDLRDWSLLVSGAQGGVPARIRPWASTTLIPSGAFVVLMSSTVLGLPPAEMPGTAFYYPLSPSTGTLPLGGGHEYSIALYDEFGRLADLVRSTARGTEVVHNHPRAPSAWDDFRGAARRTALGAGIGRTPGASDTDTGADWRPTLVRSMGLPNTQFADGPGDGAAPDVRLYETGEGDGMTLVVNAGMPLAGANYYLLFSLVRSDGAGPVAGLALDSLSNFATWTLSGIPPLRATLDSEGSCRFDIPRASLPPGLRTDNIVLIQGPVSLALPFGAIRTQVLEFDT